MTTDYHRGFISSESREELRERDKERQDQLGKQIALLETRVQRGLDEQGNIAGAHGPNAGSTRLEQEVASARQELLSLAERAASDAVREFAGYIIDSQGQLGQSENVLRDYTAQFIGEYREKLGRAPVFRAEPLPQWRQDPVAQNAIHTCEELISERRKIEAAPRAVRRRHGTGDGVPPSRRTQAGLDGD